MSEITSLISTVGFPIAMCVAMGWFVVKIQKDHKEEVAKLTTAVENNTIAMTKLVAKLGEVDE